MIMNLTNLKSLMEIYMKNKPIPLDAFDNTHKLKIMSNFDENKALNLQHLLHKIPLIAQFQYENYQEYLKKYKDYLKSVNPTLYAEEFKDESKEECKEELEEEKIEILDEEGVKSLISEIKVAVSSKKSHSNLEKILNHILNNIIEESKFISEIIDSVIEILRKSLASKDCSTINEVMIDFLFRFNDMHPFNKATSKEADTFDKVMSFI